MAILPHSTLSEDRVISSLFNIVIEIQRQISPSVNTSRKQRDLFTVQCCHWHSKADIPPSFNTIRGQSDLCIVQCFHWHSKEDIPTQSTLSVDRVISSLFNVVIETQRQIYLPVNTSRGQSDLFTVQCCHWHSKVDIPPLVNTIRGQSDLFTVQCCHWHSKEDLPTQSTLSVDRVISSLFSVVIDTQRQISLLGQL